MVQCATYRVSNAVGVKTVVKKLTARNVPIVLLLLKNYAHLVHGHLGAIVAVLVGHHVKYSEPERCLVELTVPHFIELENLNMKHCQIALYAILVHGQVGPVVLSLAVDLVLNTDLDSSPEIVLHRRPLREKRNQNIYSLAQLTAKCLRGPNLLDVHGRVSNMAEVVVKVIERVQLQFILKAVEGRVQVFVILGTNFYHDAQLIA